MAANILSATLRAHHLNFSGGQPSTSTQSRRPFQVNAAADGLCKDKVNVVKKELTGLQGTATVAFLGVGGQRLEVQCPLDSYILDAGLDNGVELPYTCRGGICGACVGRVVKGQVDQSDIDDLSFTLSDEEVEQGMALICMSRPVGDCVEIETQSDWGYSLGVGEWKGPSGHIQGKEVNHLDDFA